MKISRKNASNILENGASTVVYPDSKGEKYGFMIYSLNRGQPHERIIRTRRPFYSNEEKAKEKGNALIEKIILTFCLENSMMYLN